MPVVAERAAPTAQSMVNTGTAVGVTGAGVLAFAKTSTTHAWVGMALVCAASAGAILLVVHRGGLRATAATVEQPATTSTPARWGPLVVPGGAALVVGAGTALIWAFGPLE